MKIGIFGGSFDPIHKGHILLANYAIKKLNLDKLIFVPSYKNPFKTQQKYESFSHRFKMIQDILPLNCELSDFEGKRKCITYSYEVIQHFKRKDNELFFLIGSDNFKMFNKWKNVDLLLKYSKLVVFKRGENKIKKKDIKKYNAIYLENQLFNFSSTEYKMGKLSMVNHKTQTYISSNFLYLNSILFNTLPHKRYVHSLNTAKLAKKLAEKYSINTKEAFFAGLMHDYTKYWSYMEHKTIIKNFNKTLMINDIPKEILHQYSAGLWMNKIYLSNYKIGNAIYKHTTADMSMNKLDMVIYLSDKLATGRIFPDIQKQRELAFKDLEKAFCNQLKITKQFLLEKKCKINLSSKNIFDHWEKKCI